MNIAVRQNLSTDSQNHDSFARRHIGPNAQEIEQMLKVIGFSSLEQLIEQTIPSSIQLENNIELPPAQSEANALAELKAIASKNKVFRSFIGMGYYNCYTPGVIQRNILENPGWYTAYTPYQAEIAQGRLEALLNFQTMIIDLTGLEIANASLLDEGTAAAEAMSMSYGLAKNKANAFFVSNTCHPQTIEVLKTRANPLGIEIIIGDYRQFDFEKAIFGAILQYPATDGTIYDYREFIQKAQASKALVTIAADPLSLTLLTPPGELGADIAVGSTQRFGVPLGYGGPHAAYLATRKAYQRSIPGRIVGVSKDAQGKRALRLALQTREQHIRRDKATSNICTAQVLLAVMASMYAIYHGPEGIKNIAKRVHQLTLILAEGLKRLGYKLDSELFFDTITLEGNAADLITKAEKHQINLRYLAADKVGISLDETTTIADVEQLLLIFAREATLPFTLEEITVSDSIPESLIRTSAYLTEAVFNRYHSETELLRYIHQLETKDLSLNTSMIPLGSCTMKLNATAEMIPVTWAEFGQIHPFAPLSQTQGYQILFAQLESWLAEITGFAAVSLQPNAGSQGEYAGLQVIRQYHLSREDDQRHVCLIPESAHGTNPASAVMCGMKVIPIKCDRQGNIDIADLEAKATKHSEELAALMVTYPSTHGVFEAEIVQICEIIHNHGGQVYLDGANMNAQVGLCRPGDYGADVCHLNLHKTFCIPHGGGGPGVGPIGVAAHLAPFLPDPLLNFPLETDSVNSQSIGAIASAPWGSASILTISWMYIAMMGTSGLKAATQVAILNANYMAHRLKDAYPILFTGKSDLVAHECIIDLRLVKKSAGIEVDDIAKRLMDYGFHAPTVSWPVAGTMMIEPTESESKEELDRFCDAMISIRREIEAIESEKIDSHDNPLKNAPHTAEFLLTSVWEHPYSREEAAYPAPWTREYKYWPTVSRIDNAYGDRNLVCSCQGMEAYQDA
ncbi:MAG: glycine dehydrogenase (aminomethyl-transferring) [Gloeocapsa sp. DLM2.Bin57]|nr:MAG: glycine dehydrogenase (aminomethyl-transferring) [Gloeocapsa sp. DLM2.Bin57]